MIHLKDFWRTIRRTLTVFILGTTVAVFTCQALSLIHISYARVEPVDNKIRLHIFVDKSSIEIFANDGKDVFTLLTYPGEAQTGIELFAQKKGTKMELDAWMLKSIWR